MNLKRILFPSSEAEEPAQVPQPTCDAGHALDPSWGGKCPYCEAATRARERTAAVPKFEPPRAGGNDRSPTVVGDSSPSSRRETTVDSSGDSPSYKRPPDGRRIVGILATFSWKTAGEVFLLREGKNTIGAGTVSAEGQRPCDVQIRTDPELSKEHALILCRQGRYELVDLNSSNGTFLDGQMIPSQAVELKNDARIKVGATVLQFLKIEGGRGAGEGRAPEPDSDDDEPPRRGPDFPRDLTAIE